MTDQDSTPSSAATPIPWQTKAIAYFWQNPWTCLWSAVLACGGLFLLVFICRLGFLPDMNLSDLTGVLAAVAVVGLTVIGILLMLLVLPGVATREVLYASIGAATSPPGGPIAPLPPRKLDWPLIILAPTVATLLLLTIAVNPTSWAWMTRLQEYIDVNRTMGLVFGIHLVVTALKAAWNNRAGDANAYERGVMMWLSSLCWIVAMVLVIQFTLLMAKDNPDLDPDLGAGVVTLVGYLLILAVAGFNITLVYVKKAQARQATLVIAPVLLVLLMSVTQNYGFFSQFAAERLGFAQRLPTSLVVSKTGCATVNGSIRGARFCVPDEKADAVTLCPVRVKSRLGSQVILEVARAGIAPNGALQWNVGKSAQQVVLRKEDVLGWGISAPRSLQGPKPSTPLPSTQGLASIHADHARDHGQAGVKQWCQAIAPQQ